LIHPKFLPVGCGDVVCHFFNYNNFNNMGNCASNKDKAAKD